MEKRTNWKKMYEEMSADMFALANSFSEGAWKNLPKAAKEILEKYRDK